MEPISLLQNKRILLGISGGIAAWKAVNLLRTLQKAGAQVRCAMTPSARHFIGEETLKALTRHSVFVDIFSKDGDFDHIAVPQWAEMLLIAPATANTIAKCAHGISDEALSLSFLVCQGPKIIVPAMNPSMYNAPATQKNLNTLREYGAQVLTPETGLVACGDEGPGRFPEESAILAAVLEQFRLQVHSGLTGRKVLITAGRTEEAIDPVRYISNRSSGKTALALAQEFWEQGADVELIHGPMDLSVPPWLPATPIQSAREMHAAVMDRFASTDIAIMNAAVADFRPAQTGAQKIKDSSALQTLDLTKNPNILQECGQQKSSEQLLIGFSLETDAPLENAQAKMSKSPCDLMVVNTPVRDDSGFGKDSVWCSLLTKSEGSETPQAAHGNTAELAPMNKTELAKAIREFCDKQFNSSNPSENSDHA